MGWCQFIEWSKIGNSDQFPAQCVRVHLTNSKYVYKATIENEIVKVSGLTLLMPNMLQMKFNVWFCVELLPSLASKREHVTPKHALIGCQTRHDWSSNIWSVADRGANFCAKSLAHEMVERLDIEDFFREIDSQLCQYAYAFCKSGFTSGITMKIYCFCP